MNIPSEKYRITCKPTNLLSVKFVAGEAAEMSQVEDTPVEISSDSDPSEYSPVKPKKRRRQPKSKSTVGDESSEEEGPSATKSTRTEKTPQLRDASMETDEAQPKSAQPETFSVATEANTPTSNTEVQTESPDFQPIPLGPNDPNATMNFAMSRKSRKGRIVAHGFLRKEFYIYNDNTISMVNQGGSLRWNEADNVTIDNDEMVVDLSETKQSFILK
jgi:hypothetical protein